MVALALGSLAMGSVSQAPGVSPTNEASFSILGVLPLIIYAIGLIEASAIAVWFFRSKDPFPRRDRVPVVPLGMGAAIVAVFLIAPALLPIQPGESMRDLAIVFWMVAAARILPILMWVAAIRGETPAHVRERATLTRATITGIVGLIAIWPLVQIMQFLGAWVNQMLTDETSGPLIHDTLRALRDNTDGPWAMLVIAAVVVAVPLAEEVLYRGTIYGVIRTTTKSRLPALLISSLFFAAVHYPAVPAFALPAYVVLGLGFAIVYEITGRITACFVMHALFNLANIVLMLFIVPPPTA